MAPNPPSPLDTVLIGFEKCVLAIKAARKPQSGITFQGFMEYVKERAYAIHGEDAHIRLYEDTLLWIKQKGNLNAKEVTFLCRSGVKTGHTSLKPTYSSQNDLNSSPKKRGYAIEPSTASPVDRPSPKHLRIDSTAVNDRDQRIHKLDEKDRFSISQADGIAKDKLGEITITNKASTVVTTSSMNKLA
ncbi:hypothetical protein FDECE_16133 [Fusarium decemcellulare]|nr:hypothetical protein FDECE_16133 [Fusarium decemcellulare]